MSAALRNTSSALLTDGTPRIALTTAKGDPLVELPIVAPTQEHRSFILATWVKSYEAMARKLGWGEFYKRNEPRMAEACWQDGWVLTDEDGFTVHAWVCGYDGLLRHVYVTPQLRQCRIATRLIDFATGGLKEYARPWPYTPHARLNPYALGAK